MNELGLVVGIVALALGAFLYWKSRRSVGPDEASKIVKHYAEQQKVEVRLTAEQMEAIREQWIKDPNRPAQIIFFVDDGRVGDIKVASCPFFADTCCA